ncbi:MAG: hypothetical protein A2Y24_04800 [Clostridiales bacterium GWE2_32_10]|nr:MAG: hypothetical protein A2Y24_04800 [Clostridiales bacterium GWE2_32_10]HBY20301.1 hypothetical protein [Clostridiales bacterium]
MGKNFVYKGVAKMFRLFKKKDDTENDTKEVVQQDIGEQTRKVMEDAKASLGEIENKLHRVKGKYLFSNLLLFISYYHFIIDFYNKNIESIISVKELLLLKYINMTKDILTNFDENMATVSQKKEVLKALKTVNDKLYVTIKNIKEKTEMDLSVDLKTLQDLIKTDF